MARSRNWKEGIGGILGTGALLAQSVLGSVSAEQSSPTEFGPDPYDKDCVATLLIPVDSISPDGTIIEYSSITDADGNPVNPEETCFVQPGYRIEQRTVFNEEYPQSSGGLIELRAYEVEEANVTEKPAGNAFFKLNPDGQPELSFPGQEGNTEIAMLVVEGDGDVVEVQPERVAVSEADVKVLANFLGINAENTEAYFLRFPDDLGVNPDRDLYEVIVDGSSVTLVGNDDAEGIFEVVPQSTVAITEWLTEDSDSSEVEPSSPVTVEGNFVKIEPGSIVTAVNSEVNVREETDTSSESLGTYGQLTANGEVLTFEETVEVAGSEPWHKVTLPDGRIGYIRSDVGTVEDASVEVPLTQSEVIDIYVNNTPGFPAEATGITQDASGNVIATNANGEEIAIVIDNEWVSFSDLTLDDVAGLVERGDETSLAVAESIIAANFSELGDISFEEARSILSEEWAANSEGILPLSKLQEVTVLLEEAGETEFSLRFEETTNGGIVWSVFNKDGIRMVYVPGGWKMFTVSEPSEGRWVKAPEAPEGLHEVLYEASVADLALDLGIDAEIARAIGAPFILEREDLSADRDFVLYANEDGEVVAGLFAWRGQKTIVSIQDFKMLWVGLSLIEGRTGDLGPGVIKLGVAEYSTYERFLGELNRETIVSDLLGKLVFMDGSPVPESSPEYQNFKETLEMLVTLPDGLAVVLQYFNVAGEAIAVDYNRQFPATKPSGRIEVPPSFLTSPTTQAHEEYHIVQLMLSGVSGCPEDSDYEVVAYMVGLTTGIELSKNFDIGTDYLDVTRDYFVNGTYLSCNQ